MRLASGHEALIARVLTTDGRTAFGFSLRLDATEARHMAEWHAGEREDRPLIEAVVGHPWEAAFVANHDINWSAEPSFGKLLWLPQA